MAFSGLMLILLAIVIPVVFAVVLFVRRKSLWKPSVKAQIGSMYLGLNTDRVISLTYTIVFMVRRSLFVVVMFFLSNQPAIQMNLFIFMSNLYIIYLNQVSPYEEKQVVITETFNEVMLMLICYHFILLTDLLSDQDLKYEISKSMIGFIIAMISINMIIILRESLKPAIRNCKKKRLQKKHAKKMAKILERIKKEKTL